MAKRLSEQLAICERDMSRLLAMEDRRWMHETFALIDGKIKSLKKRIAARDRARRRLEIEVVGFSDRQMVSEDCFKDAECSV